ncbi:MAG: hypothetical protein HRU41_10715 [Saprospiraceae bacterium]|nr:hypothetical protein [Saprospiraceae bacterium]
MKTIRPILLNLALYFVSVTLLATPVEDNYEEILRVHLNNLLGSKSFSFQSLDVQAANKSIGGNGTFFGTSNVGFEL